MGNDSADLSAEMILESPDSYGHRLPWRPPGGMQGHIGTTIPGCVVTPHGQRHESFVDVLRTWAAADPDGLAFYGLADMRTPLAHYTYAQADRRVRSIAAHLQALSAARARALVVLENEPDYLLAFLACNYANVVAVTLNVPSHRKHAERLAHVARDCDARFLLTSRSIATRHRTAIEEAIEEAGCPDLIWCIVEDIPDGQDGQWQPRQPARHEIAYLQYTSGSTGTPRGVVITHGNLIHQSACLQELFSFTRRDRGLSWLPMFHDMGLVLGALQPLYSGFPVAIARPSALARHPDRWLRAISDHRITFSGGPNFLYDLCVDAMDPETMRGLDLSCLDVALNAAEPVRARSIQRFCRTFTPFGFRAEAMNPGYGLAEATLAVTVKPRGAAVTMRRVLVAALAQGRIVDAGAADDARDLVSSGVSAADTDVRIVDPPTGCELPTDTIGEIWATSPGMPKAYWRQEETSKAIFEASIPGDSRAFLRTGDLGFLDAAGNLFITGRLKDVLIFAGKNHYPQDIEETIEAVDPVIRPSFSAAISLGEDGCDRLAVLAEIRNDRRHDFDPARLATRIRAQVADVHGVTVAQVVLLKQGQLPKTTSGKIQRGQCRARLAAGEFETCGQRPGTRVSE
jgi:acyl-CoA synthetase (AMP-forming)/AMP-acid ligase II